MLLGEPPGPCCSPRWPQTITSHTWSLSTSTGPPGTSGIVFVFRGFRLSSLFLFHLWGVAWEWHTSVLLPLKDSVCTTFLKFTRLLIHFSFWIPRLLRAEVSLIFWLWPHVSLSLTLGLFAEVFKLTGPNIAVRCWNASLLCPNCFALRNHPSIYFSIHS